MVMGSFATLVDEAFQNAENRTREIGALMAETSQSAGGMIEQRFADIRTNITTERERTAAAMRAAYEQANAEIDGIFNQGTRRFETAASELREMSREIQEELAATREALRVSAAELPQETAQQAASMRKIVADEIKALKELSEIVSRSGRAFDVAATPARAPQPATPRPQAPPAIPAAPSIGAAPFGAPAPIRRAPAAQPEPQTPAPEPRNAQTPPPRAGRPEGAPASERGGWLSDLLARASTDEPPAPPRTLRETPKAAAAKPASAGQPIDALSLDVARMIDPQAASEAWERHQRGEQGSFSHRIYIGRGAQTFDEVRRRYRLNPEFHATVDRYVQEFERLLNELNRDNPDQSVLRSYLLSETGLVYTMLAHRLGQARLAAFRANDDDARCGRRHAPRAGCRKKACWKTPAGL